MTVFAEVILFLPLNQSFVYTVPPGLQSRINVGFRVLVPFHQKKMTGIVVRILRDDPGYPFALKPVDRLLDVQPIFSSSFLAFTRRMSRYFHCAWGELLHIALPPSFVLKSTRRISLTPFGKKKATDRSLLPGDRRILRFLGEKSYSDTYLKKALKTENIAARLVRLEEKGLIRVSSVMRPSVKRRPEQRKSIQTQLEIDFSLSEKIQRTARRINRDVKKGQKSLFLICGSFKKRESVYFELIRSALSQKTSVLFLLPEISMAEPMAAGIEKRLGIMPAVLHSRLSERRREKEWERAVKGISPVVIGPRSSILFPVKNLGLIIVDEEQDDSYSQQDHPVYDARTGACIRADHDSVPLVFGSEMPTVETLHTVEQTGVKIDLGEDDRLMDVSVAEMGLEKGPLAEKTRRAVARNLKKKKQILVFLNRLGYASYMICRNCGYIPRCPKCDVSLAFHKSENKLICHYCRFLQPLPEFCPVCGTGTFRSRGVGIEVLGETLRTLFPGKNVKILGTLSVRGHAARNRLIQEFRKGTIDILVGTQLMAHLSDLPKVSLAVVMFPESLLALSDFQAAQKTYQYLNRCLSFVANVKGGTFLVQTSLPGHYAVDSFIRGDYAFFSKKELDYRQLMGYPPFLSMAECLLASDNVRTLSRVSRKIFASLSESGLDILGPSKVSWAKIKGKHRVQIIVKSPSKLDLDGALENAMAKIKIRHKIILYG